MSEINYYMGQRIRGLRKKLGWSQKDLADGAGVQQTHISKIEKGQSGISTEKLQSLADTLKTSLSYLLGETDNPDRVEEVAASTILHDKNEPDELISLLARVREQMISEYPGMDINDQAIVKSLLAKIYTLVDDTAERNENIA